MGRIGVGARLDQPRTETPAPVTQVSMPEARTTAVSDTAERTSDPGMKLDAHSTAAEGIATNARGATTDVAMVKATQMYSQHTGPVHADTKYAAGDLMPHNKGKLHYEGRGGDLKLDEGMDADKTLKSNNIKFTGVPANMSKAESDALKQAVATLAVTNEMSGYEADVRIEVNGKLREATIQIDDKGNATATLHPAQAAAKPLGVVAEQRAKQDWKNKLEKDFGVKITEAGGEKWTSADLKEMHAVFSTFNKDEKEALKGLTIQRTDQIALTADEQKHFGNINPSGLYRGGNGRGATIQIDNDAFKSNANRFVGDATNRWSSSMQTVIHEVGHAVADRKGLEARNELTAAQDALAKTDGKFMPAKIALAQQYPVPQDDVDAYVGKADKVDSLLAQRQASGLKPADKVKLDKAIAAAVKDRDAAFGKLSSGDQARAQPIQTLQNQRQAAVERLDKAEGAMKAHAGHHSAREEAFEKVVDKPGSKNDVQPFTDYASASWKKGDKGEFFAEAFALYKLDPQFLKDNYKEVHDFFANGGHLK